MNEFSIRETNITKGVACILLLFHHLFYHPSLYDMFYHILEIGNTPLIAKIALMAKVCVAIFVILSGYGLTKSFEKNSDSSAYFTYRHIVKLLCQYWFVFIIFVPLGFFLGRNPVEIYGTGIKGIIKYIIDFMGLAHVFGTRTMNATWWYMGLIIILYMLFPIFYMTIKKYSYLSLAGAFLICIFGTVTGRWYDVLLAWIFPFVTGIYLAQKGILDRLSSIKRRKMVSVISFLFVIIFAVIRTRFSVKVDAFFGLSIIIFTLVMLSDLKYISTALEFIGIHSGNIFMLHTFIYFYYCRRTIYAPYYPILILLCLLLISLAISLGLEKLKTLLGYKRLNDLLFKAGGFLK